MIHLRPLRPDDAPMVLAVVIDAVQSQASALYRLDQIRAWCEHAGTSADLTAALDRGQGWASVDLLPASEGSGVSESLEAFALRDPADRLSLLYCRGRSCRQGRASALLQAIEEDAVAEGQCRLRTEASQLSRPLLERRGWQVEAAEVVVLAGVSFERWRMVRSLEPRLPAGGSLPPENGGRLQGDDG